MEKARELAKEIDAIFSEGPFARDFELRDQIRRAAVSVVSNIAEGFELIPFEDHIAFRYAYESKFRSRWDRGEQTELVVVLRSQASDLGGLPFDLLQAGRRLSFNLGDIFSNLSYPVVAALDRGDLDALYEAHQRHAPGQLSDNATKELGAVRDI